MKTICATILSFFFAFSIVAQTSIPGPYTSGNWIKANSPYLIYGNITVHSDSLLNIEHGVEVVFQNEYSFTIEGILHANGIEGDSIRFTVQDTTGYASGSYTGWNGLLIYYAADSSYFDYCIVEYSKTYGIYCEESDFAVKNSNVRFNSTGIFVVAGSGIEIDNSEIRHNRADGLFVNHYSSVVATNVTTSENSNIGISVFGDCNAILTNFNSENNGGTGIVVHNSLFSIIGGSVSNNLDGGFSVDGSNTAMHNITIASNDKTGNGGGIFCNYGGVVNGTNLIIQYNIATEGGGIYASNQSNIVLDSSTFYYNQANVTSGSGGGICIDRSTVSMSNSSINSCVSFNGGGIYIVGIEYEPSYLTGSNLIISNNTALASGGGLYCLTNTHIDLDSTTIYNNHADLVSGNGGGLYAKAANLTLLNSLVTNGRAYNGGGMYIDSSDYQITGGRFSGNVAEANGGGIYQRLGIADISGVQFSNNSGSLGNPASAGGGIYCEDANLTLSDLNFTNNLAFDAGGGIYSLGSILNLGSVDFSGCGTDQGGGGGGMYIIGSPDCDLTDVTITNCYGTSGGGIVCSGSTVSLLNVIIDDNSSDYYGGGLECLSSTLTILNVEITDNDADRGGGLYCSSSTLSLLNVEIYNNVSFNDGGGIYNKSSDMNLERALIYDNMANSGGGLYLMDNSSIDIINTTFVNNSSGNGTAIYCEAGSSTNLLNSIIWQHVSPAIAGTGSFTINYSDIEGGWAGTGNIGSDPLFVDPGMDDYNLSWLNFPVPDATRSPCIDAGDPISPSDPDGTRTDMGAYYYHQTFTSISGNINDTLKCSESPYYVFGDLTVLTGDDLVIEPCVHLVFIDDFRLTVEGRLLAIGNTTDSIWFYPADTIIGWQGIRFLNQNTNGQDSSKLEYCKIKYGKADGPGEDSNGGGIYCNNSSELLIKNCELSHNYATNAGGGIYADSSSFLMQGCHFSFNEADYDGGGIYFYNSPGILIESTEIMNCIAWEDGGGLFLIDCINPVITNSYVEDNFGANDGGGIRLKNCPNSTIMNCLISNNQAYLNGGGINIENSSNVVIDSCSFLNCQVFELGGGVSFDNTTGLMNNCEIDSCSAGFGGGLYSFSSNLQITNSYIIQNHAKKGGGMYSDSCENQITGGEFSGNDATGGHGGGIYQRLGAVIISGVQFINNNADQLDYKGEGGGIFCDGANLTLSDLNFTNNSAFDNGGGIFSSGSILNLNNVEFNNNSVWFQGSRGGGMDVYDSPHCNLVDVHFFNNDADMGAGLCCSGSSISILNAEFLSNSALLAGGGICSWGSSLDLNNVEFNNNLVSNTYYDGGGSMYVSGSSVSVLNVEMSNNVSLYNGGGVFMSGNSSMEVINTTLCNNSAVYEGNAIYVSSNDTINIKNSIIWNHNSPIISNNGALNVTYSDIEGGWPGTANIDTDPMFVDPGNDDFNLSWANFPVNDATKSPCIDIGDPLSPKDPDSTRVDMGAYFYDQYYELDIKTFLEGPFFFSQMIPFLNIAQYIPLSQPYSLLPWYYDGTESVPEIPNDDIIDWLLIELRDANNAENATGLTTFERQAVFLKADGSVVGLDGINFPRFNPLLTNDLYVVIRHRNHLGILSSAPPELNGRVFSYDFTDGEDKVFGEDKAHKQIYSGTWGMMAADGNADGQTDNKDKNDIWYLQRFLSGYLSGDFDMDTDVDLMDMENLLKSNSGKSSFVPE